MVAPIRSMLSQSYVDGVIKIGGKDEAVTGLSPADVEIFARQLERFIHETVHTGIKDVIARNAQLILDVVRSVNVNTKQGFKGMAARGNELTFSWIRPKTWNHTTWLRTLTATGTQTAILASTKALEEEGMVILGWIDPIEVPKSDAILFTKDGDAVTLQSLNFAARDGIGLYKLPFVEAQEPITLLPERTGLVTDNAFVVGDDSLQPIGFHIRLAKDFLSLPGPVFGT